MTITDADIEAYQSTVSEFMPQIEPDACYPTAIKNVLDRLADRKGLEEMS